MLDGFQIESFFGFGIGAGGNDQTCPGEEMPCEMLFSPELNGETYQESGDGERLNN